MAYKSIFDYYSHEKTPFPLYNYLRRHPKSDKYRKWFEGLGFPDEEVRDPRETAEVRFKMGEICLAEMRQRNPEELEECPNITPEDVLWGVDNWAEKFRGPLLEKAIMEVEKDKQNLPQ